MFVGLAVRRPRLDFGGSGLSALGRFDFVNDIYSWNGVTLTAADVVDQTAWITANGLELPGNPSSGANLIYSDATTFLGLCAFSAVFEVEILTSTNFPGAAASHIFEVRNSGLAYGFSTGYQHGWIVGATDGTNSAGADDSVNSISTGLHKLAVTQTNDISALSIDGFATQSDIGGVSLPVPGFPMAVFRFGHTSQAEDVAFNLRSVSFYDPVGNQQLQELTA